MWMNRTMKHHTINIENVDAHYVEAEVPGASTTSRQTICTQNHWSCTATVNE